MLELAKNPYTKIIKTSHGLRILHAESTLLDTYLALVEVSIEAENYRMAVKALDVALGLTEFIPAFFQ